MIKIKKICGHSFIGNWINRNSIVIDMGMHTGEFSSEIHQLYNPIIHGFEPNPDLFDNIPDIPGTNSYNMAISDKCGVKDFFINKDNNESSSLIFKGANTRSVQVPTIKLETFLENNKIKRVDLLKIDIEGEEINFFDSTSDEVFEHVSQITVEFHDFIDPKLTHDVQRVIDRLYDLGFYKNNFSRNNGDTLFINQNIIKLTPVDRLMINISKYSMGGYRILKRHLVKPNQ